MPAQRGLPSNLRGLSRLTNHGLAYVRHPWARSCQVAKLTSGLAEAEALTAFGCGFDGFWF